MVERFNVRIGEVKPPLPIQQRTGGRATPLCVPILPTTPAISAGQQDTLVSDEGMAQFKPVMFRNGPTTSGDVTSRQRKL